MRRASGTFSAFHSATLRLHYAGSAEVSTVDLWFANGWARTQCFLEVSSGLRQHGLKVQPCRPDLPCSFPQKVNSFSVLFRLQKIHNQQRGTTLPAAAMAANPGLCVSCPPRFGPMGDQSPEREREGCFAFCAMFVPPRFYFQAAWRHRNAPRRARSCAACVRPPRGARQKVAGASAPRKHRLA